MPDRPRGTARRQIPPPPARRPPGPALALLATALLAGCPQASPPPSSGDAMPVVLIVVDTLRADHLGFYGYERSTSPSLDDWAKRGAVFERAFATSPWTLPSLASIHTGLLPERHAAGIRVEAGESDPDLPEALPMDLAGDKASFTVLADSARTLPEILREHGYATGAVVNNLFLHPEFGLARGFVDYDYDPGTEQGARRADATVDRALEWVDAHLAEPFFLFVHLFDPHMSYDPPPPYRGRFTGEESSGRARLPVTDTPEIRKHAASSTSEERHFIAAAYDEEIAFLDQQLGRFLRALEQRGITGRGLVLLSADHGEELFERDFFGHGHSLHGELLRIPLVVWGAQVVAGRVDAPASIADLAPSVLDAVGLTPPPGMQGISLWPAIRGEELPPRTVFAGRIFSGPERRAVIEWPYKLITAGDEEPALLFDLSADPGERRDLAAARPALRDGLAALAEAGSGAHPAAETPRAARLDEATREELRTLGYLE